MTDYDQWNQAIADVVFTEDNAGRPVYLDLEADVLRAIAEAADGDADEAMNEFSAAVSSSLLLGPSDTNPLANHLRDLRGWRRRIRNRRPGEQLETPPCLALLALFALAAEQMGEDPNYAPNAFYPRLCGLLRISNTVTQHRLETSYRQHAEEIWHALNEWLEALDGALGTPTAYALSYRYVGLALSQALVRGRDRAKFPSLFRNLGLAPGSQIAPTDMIQLLSSWITQEPCPVSISLRKLWDAGAAQERIATVAALELEAWDGTSDEPATSGAARHDLRLLASLRTFPTTSLQLSISASLPGAPPRATVTVASADGDPPTLELEPGPDGWLRPRELSDIDADSLISGLLQLKDTETGTVLTRRPRPVVAFRKDELTGSYVEVERVQLGDDNLILAAKENGLADNVDAALTRLARPGFKRRDNMRGLPEAWELFSNVQVMAADSALPTVLNPLVPIMTSQLTFAGGLKLPGRIRKFSSLDPPEIRAITQNTETIRVTLETLHQGDDRVQRSWDSPTFVTVVQLDECSLPDGDYVVRLFEGANKNPRQQNTLRLRSGDTVDAYMWEHATRLSHVLDGTPGWSMLSASALPETASAFVDGPMSLGPESFPQAVAPRLPWWTKPRPASAIPATAPAIIAQPDPTSCVVTGAHRIQLPVYYGNRKDRRTHTIEGVCSSCGLVKRYPARPPSPWKRAGGQSPAPAFDVSRLPAVKSEAQGWDVALDGLMHAGGGEASSLQRVAVQVEESALFLDTFVRNLVTLGHIQVERGPDLRPTRWEITPSYVAELPDRELVLVGYWPTDLRNMLAEIVAGEGAVLNRENQRVPGPSVWRMTGIDAQTLAKLLPEEGDLADVAVVPDAAHEMAAVLTPLSRIAEALPTTPLPGARSYEYFDLGSASWVKVSGIARPGAYRLTSAFTTTYIYSSADEWPTGMGRVGTAQLVKHLAAHASGKPLIAYEPESRQLSVALGADLPDLYGRAASLCSGALPVDVRNANALVYPDVPADIASVINAKLAS